MDDQTLANVFPYPLLHKPSVTRGYFGLAHRDTVIAREKKQLKEFIARFKHALLFTPKLVLADHMVFSPNFQAAYQSDEHFKKLLTADLVDIAYFEKYANGPAFTLVEYRKFQEFLRRKQHPEYDPRDPACPRDPFDSELELIELGAGRLVADGAKRDPLFSAFAETEVEEDTLRVPLGDFYQIYKTAYWALLERCKTDGVPFGIVHFDETHRAPGTVNIFDLMAQVASHSMSRAGLVQAYKDVIAHAHRVLLLKAERCLLPGVHAILPGELRPYQNLSFMTPGIGPVDESEAQRRTFDIDLSAVNADTLASLSREEILEMRKAAAGLFDVMQTEVHKPDRFDFVCKTLKHYVEHLNRSLGFKHSGASAPGLVRTGLQVIQGKLATRPGLTEGGIGFLFKVLTNVSHSAASHAPLPEADAVIDTSLKAMEARTKASLTPPLGKSIKDVKAHVAFLDHEELMQYE